MSVVAETIGMAAAALTTLAYLPQSLRTIRTRSTGDISLKMLALLSAGLVLWVLYGAFLGSVPLVAANIVTLALVGPILYYKLASLRRKKEGP
jgi:MtN3 and saliva related transmembrane protein